MEFFLGIHRAAWLERLEVPLFLSRRNLATRKSLPRAAGRWALDSGGFTELSGSGRWGITVGEYAAEIRRYHDEIGSLAWVAPMDYMCEPEVLARTGLSVAEHQRRTVDNYLALREALADLGGLVAPVVQGWTAGQYSECADLYESAGVDLTAAPVVGVGSICRRTSVVRVGMILRSLSWAGLRLHAFGVKGEALVDCAEFLVSADSLSWSLAARFEKGATGCAHSSCANCPEYALAWRDQLLHQVERNLARSA